MGISPDKLPLSRIEVRRFRAIRHLSLPRLARVNLIVGQNNVGKTSLLEAIRLFATPYPLGTLASILRERSGIRLVPSTGGREKVTPAQMEAAVEACRSIFNGTYDGVEDTAEILGPRSSLLLSLPWIPRALKDDLDRVVEPELFLDSSSPLVRIDRAPRTWDLSYNHLVRKIAVVVRPGDIRVQFVPPQGFTTAAVTSLWDRVADAGFLAEVEDALRLIVPGLVRVYLQGGNGQPRRIALQVEGTRRLVPIANMGDGTNRVFALALALVSARGGLLLIDEVENGLHHSVQQEVWSTIFALSAELDVQVIAATHSLDAVEGFQHAANRSREEGMLYRLERDPNGDVYAERYSERDVAIATDQQVEVR